MCHSVPLSVPPTPSCFKLSRSLLHPVYGSVGPSPAWLTHGFSSHPRKTYDEEVEKRFASLERQFIGILNSPDVGSPENTGGVITPVGAPQVAKRLQGGNLEF